MGITPVLHEIDPRCQSFRRGGIGRLRFPEMRCLFACTALALAGCSSVEGPVTVPLEILVYSTDDPRPSSGGFVSKAKRAIVEVGEAEYSLMVWAVGDRVMLGAMAKSEDRYEASFRMPQPMTFALGPDAHGNLMDAQGSETTASGAGFRGFHWVTFEMPREKLPEGSPLSLCFYDRSWDASDTHPELSPARRPYGDDTLRIVRMPEMVACEDRPNLLQSAVFEVRYVEAPEAQ